MKFLPKNFTKMYKFWIKTVDIFLPKNVHWSRKTKKICTFYSKNEAFAKKIHQNVQILDKNCSFVPKNVHKKNCNLYTKNEVFAKKFHLPKKFKNVQILDKNCSFLPKNVHVLKNKKNCNLYTKNEVFVVALYPKMYIWS